MPSRLIRFAFILCGLMVFIIGSVVLWSRTQSYVDPISEIAPCGEQLCLSNIVPDITNIGETYTLVNGIPGFKVSKTWGYRAYKQTFPYYRLEIYAQNGPQVDRIDLIFHTGRTLRSGDIVAKFGSPCAIVPDYIAGHRIPWYGRLLCGKQTTRSQKI
jgi:hypothetical protein